MDTLTITWADQLIEVVLVEVSTAGASGRKHDELSRAGRRFAAMISADLADPGSVLATLAPSVAEIVCCDSMEDPSNTGVDLSLRALNEFGVGQDYVFTVPEPVAAAVYAVDSVGNRRVTGWDAEFVAVVGSSRLLRTVAPRLAS